MTKNLIVKPFLAQLREHLASSPDAPLLIAVSGGMDSMALLHSLMDTQAQHQKPLYVATFDHQLRPEAAEDAQFVLAMAAEWGLPARMGQADVRALAAQQGLGIEAAARQARYAFFAEVMHDIGATHLATGHHQSDQAETILLHLIRGAGPEGVQAMAVWGDAHPFEPSLQLMRPLLERSKAEIAAYVRWHQLPYREDSSNTDVRYTRNKIRHQVLPLLREINPNVEGALTRFARLLALHEAETPAERAFSAQVQQRAGAYCFALAHFLALAPSEQGRMLWRYGRLAGSDMLAYGHVEAAQQRLMAHPAPFRLDWPNGVQVQAAYGQVAIGPRGPLPAWPRLLDAQAQAVLLDVPLPLSDGVALCLTAGEAADALGQLAWPAGVQLSVRGRVPGDRFAPLGMAGHQRKLKAWMIDRQIPQVFRDAIPLICTPTQIAAIVLPTELVVAHGFAPKGAKADRTIDISLRLQMP